MPRHDAKLNVDLMATKVNCVSVLPPRCQYWTRVYTTAESGNSTKPPTSHKLWHDGVRQQTGSSLSCPLHIRRVTCGRAGLSLTTMMDFSAGSVTAATRAPIKQNYDVSLLLSAYYVIIFSATLPRTCYHYR